MDYISLSWYDIPDFQVPIRISLMGVAVNHEATEPRVMTSKDLRSPPWLCWLAMEYLYQKWPYVPLVVHTSRYFPHSWLIIGFATRLTWRVPLASNYSYARVMSRFGRAFLHIVRTEMFGSFMFQSYFNHTFFAILNSNLVFSLFTENVFP